MTKRKTIKDLDKDIKSLEKKVLDNYLDYNSFKNGIKSLQVPETKKILISKESIAKLKTLLLIIIVILTVIYCSTLYPNIHPIVTISSFTIINIFYLLVLFEIRSFIYSIYKYFLDKE